MIRWYTISEYVDTQTGEIITKELIKNKKYRIINTTKTIEYENDKNGNTTKGFRKFTHECRIHEQLRAFD